MFDGFRSRWTTRLACACCTAAARGEHQAQPVVDASRVRHRRSSVIGWPSTQLHREVRPAVGADAAVDERGNRRVLKARQDLPLAAESREHLVRCRRRARMTFSATC